LISPRSALARRECGAINLFGTNLPEKIRLRLGSRNISIRLSKITGLPHSKTEKQDTKLKRYKSFLNSIHSTPQFIDVDLNPIRLAIAPTPEQLNFTRIQLRIKSAIKDEQPPALIPFTGNEHQQKETGISFSLKDYLTLEDETGRLLRDDKRGAINTKVANILARLHISDESWLKLTSNFEGMFTGAVGTAEQRLNNRQLRRVICAEQRLHNNIFV
jgi:hypothetical protein